MEAMFIKEVNKGYYKGVLIAKANEATAITTPEITINGVTHNMIDGSVIIEVDTNAKHILYEGVWYKRQ